MKRVNKEATLREVLAEVNLMDLGALLKSGFIMLGCYGLLVGVILIAGALTAGGSDGKPWFGLPDWAVYIFAVWILLGGYTADQSYHEHKFAIYFPRAGFLWSIPIAIYLVFGFRALPSFDPASDWAERVFNWLLWMAYWTPIALCLGVLEIGHRKLIEKRERELAEGQSSRSSPNFGER
jgi:hypothetical protein